MTRALYRLWLRVRYPRGIPLERMAEVMQKLAASPPVAGTSQVVEAILGIKLRAVSGGGASEDASTLSSPPVGVDLPAASQPAPVQNENSTSGAHPPQDARELAQQAAYKILRTVGTPSYVDDEQYNRDMASAEGRIRDYILKFMGPLLGARSTPSLPKES